MVICKNIIINDGYCKECRHSKQHEKDDSCGEDCPYDLAINQECIECENPLICEHSQKCLHYECPHIVVHEPRSNCTVKECPYSKKYVSCISVGDIVY